MNANLQLAETVEALRRGGVIAYPTEAVWGLGCDPFHRTALTRLLALKQRDPAKGVILVAADMDQFAPWLEGLSDQQLDTLAASWPGPNTWLVPDNGHTPALVRGDHDRVALRVSDHPGVQALCRAFGGPLVSTSANHAGEPPAMSEAQIRQFFADELDAIVPGALGGNPRPSTIRDLLSGTTLRS
ncbi:threonylcarbamoyl-AMP synthase [Halomonas cupida]|uniref:Threonylcarbamoyl-AMP synthase n=1 Tax=Halomonas cupida TaxID=44933 RepID=A0A1M7IQL2_9GAMM|nr:Sua5/YciO/YrdC/YwlC family protein [Halomonas cupida]GEN24154.1 threonylcarbamoyl-AMP synthase [Halomonas cupida]SHM43106.1 L-threonylcarbamoyladenylate synthase [Halomonas cupida]